MIYRLLGELEIGPAGRLLRLPSGPALIILAALLLNANRLVPKTDLIRAGWGTEDVNEAQLHKRIKQARDLLAKIDRQADIQTRARVGYELRVADDDVDSLLFQQLVRNANDAEAGDRRAEAVDYLRAALRLWRGPHPLSNVPTNAFHHDIATLEQRHRSAAVRLFDLELESGNHERILDELLQIAGYYPADLRLCEQLMAAELRCRHLTDAANAYERYQSAFADETGGDPDALVRTFHFAIARNDVQAIAVAEAQLARRAGRRTPPAQAGPRQLPGAADLVGRDYLAAEVRWLLRRQPGPAVPVVVISGPGGIGKTALALSASHESADRYPDGQLYMELRGTAGGPVETSEILAQFLRALEVARVPDTKNERLSTYRTLLANRRVLVVLDDAVDGDQVKDLVPANPACAVLVTARLRLPELSGAHHVAQLEPLNAVHARELFLRVVHDAGIDLDDNRDAVDRVVALCGGLPLALRIAGALRVHDHPRPTSELADRLAQQGPEGFSYGKMSVARTIGAGFDRLDAAGRQLFLGLGLLPLSRFGLWTAAALLDSSAADGAMALSQLAASFMIETAGPDTTYGFHDLTREYARRRALAELRQGQDAQPARAYRALLTLVRRAHAGLYGGDFEVVHSDVPDWDAPAEVLAEVDASPREWFERERSNIRTAIEHCAVLGLVDVCWDLAVSVHEFYGTQGYFDDWLTTHMVARDACAASGDLRGEGIVLACLNQPALVATRRASGESVVAELERAVDLLTGCGDRHGQAIALRALANGLRRQGHLSRPLAKFTEALGHYQASGDTVGQWQTMRFIGQTHFDRGDFDEARRMLVGAETLVDELSGERDRLIAQTRYWLGQTYLGLGDIEAAQAAFEFVLMVYHERRGIGYAYARHGLGDVARHLGAFEQAERHYATAAELAHDGVDAALEGRVWLSAGALHQAQGQPDEEEAALTMAADVFAACGAVYLEIRALAGLARASTAHSAAAAVDDIWARIESRYDEANVPDVDRQYRRDGAGADPSA